MGDPWWRLTYDGGGLRALDEGQGAVVGLFGRVDGALLQLVLPQEPLQLAQKPHPLVALLVAVGQDEHRALLTARRHQLGRRHLGDQSKTGETAHAQSATAAGTPVT